MTDTQHQFEILDLRHFSAKQLRPLLEQEAQLWQRRLRWDYRSSTELLLQYLDSRILPGFVALSRGKVCGYTFCVYEGHKAVIGDVYVAQEIESGLAATQALTGHLLDVLEASPDVERIEAQLLLFDAGTLTRPFAGQAPGQGFVIFPRLFEECDLKDIAAMVRAHWSPVAVPGELELCAWAPGFYQPTAELIHAAYEGHIDAQINDQYRTLHGSLRFLHNIVRFPGCGVFDAASSWILRDRRTHLPVASVLCSRISPNVAHVTQLCVSPHWRGRRLGETLMRHCMQHLPAQGYTALTLTVTEANEPAVRLYRELGFTTRHRFDAMVRDKGGQPHRIPLDSFSDR
ncbi:Acetyltransferase (GNAT) family protein [Granulicella rosea]|uniref:Acetyltransferase (GNAT) family protein n=1 Tax=Granulicella rosea TaxID=474952 RepID=A0A239KAI2_9BACT|nr:GNAT family N-acetyltransferase [Granulicella rosea]SNT15085.1 Acetyltransferase (GNAT) family protein [Granulicella rosea]